METSTITKINGQTIEQITVDGENYIPIKPICTALGISIQSQLAKIKDNPHLSSTIRLSITVGADKKQREMASIPLKYVFGWLFTINPDNVAPEEKSSFIKIRDECYKKIWDHKIREDRIYSEKCEQEIACLENIRHLLKRLAAHNNSLKIEESRLPGIHAERIKAMPIAQELPF